VLEQFGGVVAGMACVDARHAVIASAAECSADPAVDVAVVKSAAGFRACLAGFPGVHLRQADFRGVADEAVFGDECHWAAFRVLSARWAMTFAHALEQYTASLRRLRKGLPQSGRAQCRRGGMGWPQWGHSSVMRFIALSISR